MRNHKNYYSCTIFSAGWEQHRINDDISSHVLDTIEDCSTSKWAISELDIGKMLPGTQELPVNAFELNQLVQITAC